MRYFTTEGRVNRWLYFQQTVFPSLLGGVGGILIKEGDPQLFILGVLMVFVSLAALFPAVRRLHDLNYSGGFVLLGLIPVVNAVLGLAMLFVRGTEGENRYGPDPLQSNGSQEVNTSARRNTEERISSATVEGKAQSSGKEFNPDEYEKKCPMCAEYIKLEARRCKHCGHEMSEEEVAEQIEEARGEFEEEEALEGERYCKRYGTGVFPEGVECPECGWGIEDGKHPPLEEKRGTDAQE